ncbi:Peptidyl-prolyl cis-trans isomerase [hydrothermal vent metagenome]|uniref:peptidylprolyl isomerase n=1 Tax=hydrothermal vent metagenome TaxID=652676 RepID=A0A3B1BYD8_9ZZZZ
MRILTYTIFTAFLAAALYPAVQSAPAHAAPKVASAKTQAKGDHKKKGKKMEKVAILATRHGKIVIRFKPDVAPGHVKNFIKLAEEGYYNGTTFHRVIPKFMIQGGDSNTKDADARQTHGMGGPGYTIDAEFSDTPHDRGIVSMARAQDPNSAGSQFFICVNDAHFLDGQYTAFGEVIEGMDVADKIVAEKRDGNDNPLERVEMQVTIEEREF